MVSENKRIQRRDEILVLIVKEYGNKAFNARDVARLLEYRDARGLGQMLRAMIRDDKIVKCGRTLYKIKEK